MNILINPYTGTDSRITHVYDLFQMSNPLQNDVKNTCANGVCKLNNVKLMPLDLIEKEIINTSNQISTIEQKPTVYIFTLNREDLDVLIVASKKWNNLIHNGILKLIYIDN